MSTGGLVFLGATSLGPASFLGTPPNGRDDPGLLWVHVTPLAYRALHA